MSPEIAQAIKEFMAQSLATLEARLLKLEQMGAIVQQHQTSVLKSSEKSSDSLNHKPGPCEDHDCTVCVPFLNKYGRLIASRVHDSIFTNLGEAAKLSGLTQEANLVAKAYQAHVGQAGLRLDGLVIV